MFYIRATACWTVCQRCPWWFSSWQTSCCYWEAICCGIWCCPVCLHSYYTLAWMMMTSILNLSSSKPKVCEISTLYHWNSAAHIIQINCKKASLPEHRAGVQIRSKHHPNLVNCCLAPEQPDLTLKWIPLWRRPALSKQLDQMTSRSSSTVNIILWSRQIEVKLQLSSLFLLPSKYTHSRAISSPNTTTKLEKTTSF